MIFKINFIIMTFKKILFFINIYTFEILWLLTIKLIKTKIDYKQLV